MNFSTRDLGILVSMSLAVVAISFVFPALGLTGDTAGEPPEFDISEERFDFAGDFPDVGQNAPTSGTLMFDQQQGNSIDGVNLVFIDDTDTHRTSVELQNASNLGDNPFEVVVTNYAEEGSGEPDIIDRYEITGDDDQTILHQNNSWTVEFDVVTVENYLESNMTAEVDYNVRHTPDGAGGGFSFGGLEDLARVLSFIAQTITWAVMFVIEIAVNIVSILFDVVAYMVGLFSWLTSTYLDVISGAGGFASVFVSIPGIVLSVMLAKFTLVTLSLLPTT